ncbi:MAG: hypothetical protein ACK5GN_05950 [Pseudomonadota bacterium]
MNTNYTYTDVSTNETNKSRTLQTLFQVICADNEFTLLRKTLELYCEEIAAAEQQ